MIQGRSVFELKRDYLDALARCDEDFLPEGSAALVDRVRRYYRFIDRQGHELEGHPELLLPLAVAEPQDSLVIGQSSIDGLGGTGRLPASALRRQLHGLQAARGTRQSNIDATLVRAAALGWLEGHRLRRPWFRLLNPPPSDPNPALVRIFAGHTADVTSVSFSPDGRFLVSGSDDRTLRLWEVCTGRCLALFPCDGLVHSVAVADTRPLLVAAGTSRALFFRVEELPEETPASLI